MWRRVWSSSLLTLNGWIAFDLPRAVTTLGATLLCAIVAVQAYVVVGYSAPPKYFLAYTAVLAVGCLVAAIGMTWATDAATTQRAWHLGSIVCLSFLVVYLVSRMVGLPGLESLTGRWDVAPATLTGALAVAFVGLHATVLSGINVAHPHRQHWQD